MRISWILTVVVVVLMNTGCEIVEQVLLCDPELDPACLDPARGQLSGQITVPTQGAVVTSSAVAIAAGDARWAKARAVLAAAHSEGTPSPREPRTLWPDKLRVPVTSWANRVPKGESLSPQYRAGEILVRTRDDVAGRRDKRGLAATLASALDGSAQVSVRLCNTEHLCLAELRDERGALLDELGTLAAAQTWSRLHELLRYAEPNRVLQMSRTPNDQYYPLQWHYSAMRLPAAWDITTGHPDVIAAVIDTGILTDHTDLVGRVIGGADLIDDPGIAADGDGRDDDGYDVGDSACGGGCHSHHGTHVAGTMAASTDNAEMVAGVSWEGSLLSVRALGKGGGSLFDIVGGIYWALGSEVDGVTTNPLPADVLNLSLGGSGQSDAMDEAVAAAIATGAIVVVAAGNEARDAAEVTPANAPGAITVAALGNRGDARARPAQASYSNFGSLVDIAAPGGEQAEDVDGDGYPDGVLSTVGDDVGFYQGTSMAAPHVAGVAMLAKAIDPRFGQGAFLDLLADTADEEVACPAGCGAGLVNAARVLRGLQGETAIPLVVMSPAVTRIGRGDRDAELTLENLGDVTTDVVLSVGGPQRAQVTLSLAQASLAPDERVSVHVDIAREDADTGEATLAVAFGEQVVDAKLLWSADAVNVARSVLVAALRIEGDGFTVAQEATATELDDYRYRLSNLEPGRYLILGLSDDDNDGEFEEMEGVGGYPRIEQVTEVEVVAGSRTADIDFLVAPAFVYEDDEGRGTGGVGAGCSAGSDCDGELYCEQLFEGGYCTRDCSLGSSACPTGSACFCLGDDGASGCAYRICLQECASDGECRTAEGYVCDADSTCYPP